MARPVIAEASVSPGIVTVYFNDKKIPEHFMDIEVKVEQGAVMLTCPRYDGHIFFPVEAVQAIVEAIKAQEAT